MNTLLPTLALAAVTALAPVAATAGEAVVTFSQPENYTDFPYSERDTLLKELSAQFIKQARNLPAAQELKVEVLDIDLAGEIKANFRTPTDIRVRRGRADGPEMRITFTLSENGKVLLSGEDTLTDVRYLQRSNRYYKDDELRYEKQMIEDWFHERLGMR